MLSLVEISEIVNLDRYPLHQLDTDAGESLVRDCQSRLDETGSCLLPAFLTANAVAAARHDAEESLGRAFQVNHEFAYDDVNDDTLATPLESLPPDHPRHFKSLTRIRFLARDLIDVNNPAKQLHGWSGMTDFLSRVMQQPTYPSACPLSSCILTTAEEGELQEWHFDGIDYIVTIMLEKAASGGEFEYVRGLRKSGQADDFDGVSSVFKGERDRVISLPIEPGTLTLFKGKYNLHRAAPVGKDSRRIMAILSFEREPNKTGSENYLRLFYGRSLSDLPEAEQVVRFADIG
ncbi:MAG: hypothetical protein AAF402_15345 [Pseudomonadota bacterium]